MIQAGRAGALESIGIAVGIVAALALVAALLLFFWPVLLAMKLIRR